MIRRRIGVLGGGQLGQMLAQAGTALGARFTVLDPGENPPAACVAAQIRGAYDDVDAAARLGQASDVVTYEFEHLALPAVAAAAAHAELHPSLAALETVQDRLRQKRFLAEKGISTAPFHPVTGAADLGRAAGAIPGRSILKTSRDGYDGKGQRRLTSCADLPAAWEALGRVPCVLEGFVDFQRELSLVSTRARDGQLVFYPLVENHHEHGILRLTTAPAAGVTADLQRQAESAARALTEAMAYVGTFTIEFFQVGDRLVVNELAPRVHNSGHWTIEGAVTSQFENHVRALMGLPLGSTAPRGHAAMVNLVGAMPDPAVLCAIPGLHFHDYAKAPRKARKLGHVTLVDDDAARLQSRVQQVLALGGFEV